MFNNKFIKPSTKNFIKIIVFIVAFIVINPAQALAMYNAFYEMDGVIHYSTDPPTETINRPPVFINNPQEQQQESEIEHETGTYNNEWFKQSVIEEEDYSHASTNQRGTNQELVTTLINVSGHLIFLDQLPIGVQRMLTEALNKFDTLYHLKALMSEPLRSRRFPDTSLNVEGFAQVAEIKASHEWVSWLNLF